MDGRFDFLDCLVFSNTCDGLRRLWDLWSAYIETVPTYMINNPQKLGLGGNRDYYLEELRRFRSHMEQVSGTRISDEKLGEAIDLYDETRDLLRTLSALRKQDPPLLTGVEAFEISMAATIMPGDRANPILRRVIEEASGREAEETYGTRVLVTGSILDHRALISMIEEEGGLVVADELCTSAKYYWHRIGRGGEPLEAIHAFLDSRPLCACMHPIEARFDYLDEMIDEYDVEAVIDFNLKYCHPFLYEAPLLTEALEARDVPVTVLEVGHDMSGHGQLRTRIQAFLEMLD
jgi:benzoyl-CoA reductase/2-hydroxyglutaryl-CoA dehydratase subunit BcrC/BadD/HgdB